MGLDTVKVAKVSHEAKVAWVQVMVAGVFASIGMFFITGLVSTPMGVEWRLVFTNIIFVMFAVAAYRVSMNTLKAGLASLTGTPDEENDVK